jgi:ABC-type antimicrobial peptide transport system permease subunit
VAGDRDAWGGALGPARDPIGQCLHVGIGESLPARVAPCTRVVGIVENTAQQNITDDPRFMYYLPVDQRFPHQLSTMYLRVAQPDARGELEHVRRELSRVMPGDGFVVVRPLQQVVDNQSRSWRLGAILFAAFGSLALVVALVGLYGAVSYSVEQRRHEVGVRVALGATRGGIVALVVRQAVHPVAIAVIIGIAVALIVAPRVQPLLFGQSAIDPAMYFVVAVSMICAAGTAAIIPAMRASRVDPATTLRAD